MHNYDCGLVTLNANQRRRLRDVNPLFKNVTKVANIFRAELHSGQEVGIVFETVNKDDRLYAHLTFNEWKLNNRASFIQIDKLTIEDVVLTNWTSVPAVINIFIAGD